MPVALFVTVNEIQSGWIFLLLYSTIHTKKMKVNICYVVFQENAHSKHVSSMGKECLVMLKKEQDKTIEKRQQFFKPAKYRKENRNVQK